MNITRCARLCAALALPPVALLAAEFAHAQSPAGWKPDRQVTLLVPYNPGGGTDATARAVASRLSVI